MFRCIKALTALWTRQSYGKHLRNKTCSRQYSISNHKTAAFVFDIDGVLIRGKQVLDPAKKALSELYKQYNRKKFPIAFLTNGGGCTEGEKAKQLSDWFHLPIQPDQVVLSHTPLRELSEKYNKDNLAVICVGRGHPHMVASSYGFQYVIPVEEIGRLEPTATPFCDYEKVPKKTSWNHEALHKPIGCILVMSDSTDWGRDIQIICDILQSKSCLAVTKQEEIKIYFTNPDFLWANEYPFPRFGQGAFRSALERIYEELAGKPLPYVQYGKPYIVQYR